MRTKALKTELHPKNAHRDRYDFPTLIISNPLLGSFVHENKYGDLSIAFSDPNAVKALNRALLNHYYSIKNWDIPAGNLCPPIPGRVDYLHYLQDLILESNQGKEIHGKKMSVLDIGTGANCIYPLLGNSIFGWKFTASDVDEKALEAAAANLTSNPQFGLQIELRHQGQTSRIFNGIITQSEHFDLTLCNPPFHTSREAAAEGSQRKINNLSGKVSKKITLNFGGQSNELWCQGGELAFILKMIQESQNFKHQVFWFTSLVSKKENLKSIYQALTGVGVSNYKTIEMAQGNKQSRFVAWTFLNSNQKETWSKMRWEK
jgi:23S rRNA (adenine1618-N6)-methyltransferase